MVLTTLLLSFFLLSSQQHVVAQTTSPSAGPIGTAISGNYSGPLRPQIHYSPPVGFMNDPNGMFVDASGVYHLYFQLNPSDTIAGDQHWGHATSRDLYTWTNQPIALYPYTTSSRLNITGIFTGSCVIDVNNTSGFFPNQTNGVVAIYTANTATGYQEQAIAYSHDDGYTWTQYAENPVIAINSKNFRDPKVVRHEETGKWVMAVSYAQEFTIGIFTSTDLKSWTHASNFSHHGLLGLQFECPNMVQMPFYPDMNDTGGLAEESMWLMYISINPGAPLGGSIGQYFPGRFNGTHFEAVDQVARIADFGKDNYASQFFYRDGETGRKNDVASIGWASNWQYTNYVPTGPREGWQSAMTLPRRNYLTNSTRIGYTMVSEPWDMSPVLGDVLGRNADLGNSTFEANTPSGQSGPIILSVNVTNINVTALPISASLNVTFSSSATNESITAGQNFAGDPNFWLNRGGIRGFENVFFTDKISSGMVLGSSYDLMLVVDGSVVEVFLMGGERSATMNYFLTEEGGVLDTVRVVSAGLGEASVGVEARGVVGGWRSEEGSGGIVSGNSTRTGMSTGAKRNGVVEGMREWWG